MALDEAPVGSHVCICGESFPSEMELEDHARQVHGVNEPGEVEGFVCPECGSTFGNFPQLREHWAAHGEAPERPRHAG